LLALCRTGVAETVGSYASIRVPVGSADPTAAWTAEGAEITARSAGDSEEIGRRTAISNELAADSSPAALQVVVDSLVRDSNASSTPPISATPQRMGPQLCLR
jgi:hypothetical protein